MDNNTLRLLVTKKCNRGCAKCVNKQFNFNDIPVAEDYHLRFYDTIILTGGEPMYFFDRLLQFFYNVRGLNPSCKLFMYTAHLTFKTGVCSLLHGLDGLTVTLHSNEDIKNFMELAWMINYLGINNKSLRLNVFEEVTQFNPNRVFCDLGKWDIRMGIKWLDPCPMPKNEDFMQWKELWI